MCRRKQQRRRGSWHRLFWRVRQLASSGNWAVFGFGNIGATGTKSAVVPAGDGNGHLTLYCVESPECWFEDFGSARLSAG